MLNDLKWVRVIEPHRTIARQFAHMQGLSMKHHGKDYDDWRNVQGMLGEVVLAQMLGCLKTWREHKVETLALDAAWDGGYDMAFNNVRIDCKTIAFRNPNKVADLHLYRGDHEGCDVYAAMLINEAELMREKDLHSIDWIDKVWCAGWINRNSFTQRHMGRLRFPFKGLQRIDEMVLSR